LAVDVRHVQTLAFVRSVCINLYDYLEKFFVTADRSFPTILERCPDKAMPEIFQRFLMRFYGTNVENLLSVIDNLLLLSAIGNKSDQVLYIYIYVYSVDSAS
jgi:hypothetical protein